MRVEPAADSCRTAGFFLALLSAPIVLIFGYFFLFFMLGGSR